VVSWVADFVAVMVELVLQLRTKFISYIQFTLLATSSHLRCKQSIVLWLEERVRVRV